jgi:Fe-S cluster assembly protein SufD
MSASVSEATLTGFTREAVEELSRRKQEPAWLLEKRLAAWDQFESLPWPQRTDEEWRRTDFRALKFDKLAPFRFATDGSVADAVLGDATAVSAGQKNAGVVVQQDAAILRSEHDRELAAEGIVFCDLDTAFRDHRDLIEKYFMTTAVPASFGKFEALHAALWQGGMFLFVPAGHSVYLPYRNFVVATEGGSSVFTHTIAVLEEGAEAFVVDAYASPEREGQTFTSAVVELFVAKDAKLRYVQVQDWGRNVWNFMTERAVLAEDATLNSLQVTLGSRFSKNSIGAHLRGKNSLAEMLGIYFGDGDQFFDHHTWQLHESPYATSDLEFKGALKGSARSVYSGLIKVFEGAQKTDAYQQNRNLVLSRTARADSIPNLEIKANDVRCTHGATISQVEEEHLFYLQARGVPRSEAQNLIVEGFFRPVIDRIPVEEIQGFLEGAIARKVGI